jgi:polysaccharide biosynthesis transport protein
MQTRLSPPSTNTAAESENDLLLLCRVIWRKLWLVGLISAGCVGVAVLHIVRTSPVYRSTAGIQIEQQEQKVINIDAVTKQDLSQNEVLKTFEQGFRKRSLMERIVTANGLKGVAELAPKGRVFNSDDDIVDFLLERSKASLRTGTRLIDVSFDHEIPRLARSLAQSIVEQSIQLGFDESYNAAEGASKFLVSEVDKLRQRLEKSEQTLQEYREHVGSVALQDQQNIVVEKLKQISSSLTVVKADRLRLATDYDQISAARRKPEGLFNISSVAEKPAVLALRTAVINAENEIGGLSERYTEFHPKMILARNRLNEARKAMDEVVANVAESMNNQVLAAAAREAGLEQALQEQEKTALVLSRQAIQYHVLQREVDSDRSLYQSVLNRLKETRLTMGIQPLACRIVEPATLPRMVKPQKVNALAIAIVGGLLLGCGLVLALHTMDTSIRTVDDAERLLRLPVLGAVPRENLPGKSGGLLLLSNKRDSFAAEAFRSLRANLLLLGRAEERKVFAITSAIPGEGKTFTSSNLAITFAQQGLRTLLIDTDLRLPSVEKLFFPKSKAAAGVSDYLIGHATLTTVLRRTEVPNLVCITAGRLAPNPAELLGQQGMEGLLKEAGPLFDRIVIDTAPVNAVSDALIVAKYVQTICLLIDANKTPGKAAIRALEQLRRIGAPVSGTILNRLPVSAGAGYYYHYSSNKRYGHDGAYASATG